MKKFLIGLFGLSLVLAGCGQKVEIGFDEAYKTFTDTLLDTDVFSQSQAIFQNNYISENIDLDVVSQDSELDIQGSLDISSTSSIKDVAGESDMNLSFSFFDNLTQNTTQGSGGLTINYINGGMFLRLNDFLINMGEGNAEGQLISLILQNFIGKRIKIDQMEKQSSYLSTLQGDDILSFYQLPQKIQEYMLTNQIFVEGDETIYKKYLSYNITANDKHFQGLFDLLMENKYIQKAFVFPQSSGISIQNFAGQFVIKAEDQVDLIINHLDLAQGVNMSGVVGSQGGSFVINQELLGQTLTVNWNVFKSRTKIDIVLEDGLGNQTSFALNLKPRSSDAIVYDFDGVFKISSPELSYTTNSQSLGFVFEGTYILDTTEEILFVEPQNYLLMSQLIGDEYAMSSLLTTGIQQPDDNMLQIKNDF